MKKNRTNQRRSSLQLPSTLTSDLGRIADHLIFVLCRRFIFTPILWKISIHYSLILLGPFFRDARIFPISLSMAMRIDSFNKYVAQLGWMSSICVLCPFIYLTRKMNVHSHFMRLFIITLIWYLLRWSFRQIENSFLLVHSLSRNYNQYFWHDSQTFLYLFALLVINKEVTCYDQFNNRSRILSMSITIFYVLLAILSFLWELMLIIASIFSYNILEKLCATTFATVFWLITYYVCFGKLD